MRCARLSSRASRSAGSAHPRRLRRWRSIWRAMNRALPPAPSTWWMAAGRSEPSATKEDETMKLLRYGPRGQEKPGLLDRDGKIRDLSGVIKDLTPDVLAPASLDKLGKLDPASLPAVSGQPRLG